MSVMTARREFMLPGSGFHMKQIVAETTLTNASQVRHWLETVMPKCKYGVIFLNKNEWSVRPTVNNAFCFSEYLYDEDSTFESKQSVMGFYRCRNGAYSSMTVYTSLYDCVVTQGDTYTIMWMDREE